MIGISFNVKRIFFSRRAVRDPMDRKTKRVMKRLGAFIRQSAKTSMPVRVHISKVGQAPHSHTRNIRRRILFDYNEMSQTLVVGPTLLPGVGDTGALPALEQGGISQKVFRGKGRPRRPTYIRARPFMLPALEKELPGLPQIWSDVGFI